MEQNRTEDEEMVLPGKQDVQERSGCSVARKLYNSRAKQWTSKVKVARVGVQGVVSHDILGIT